MSQFTTNRLQASSFTTIQVPSGSSPTAGSPSDVLTLTSSNGSIAIVGNAITDTIDLTVTPSGAGFAFGTIQTPLGTNPVAGSPSATLILTSSDGSLEITGDSITDAVDLKLGASGAAAGTYEILGGTVNAQGRLTAAYERKPTVIAMAIIFG